MQSATIYLCACAGRLKTREVSTIEMWGDALVWSGPISESCFFIELRDEQSTVFSAITVFASVSSLSSGLAMTKVSGCPVEPTMQATELRHNTILKYSPASWLYRHTSISGSVTYTSTEESRLPWLGCIYFKSAGQCWKELGVTCRNVWNFAQGLKFKADFHSK